jgi:thymidylate synthase ThyX
MEVKLSFLTTFEDLIKYFRTCSDTLDMCGTVANILHDDKKIIWNNLVNCDNPHIQIRKMISINYSIQNVTRALLQEFARHPIGNPFVVKSTRYALHKIAKDDRIIPFLEDVVYLDTVKPYNKDNVYSVVSDYYYIPENDFIDDKEKDNWIHQRYYELCKIKYYKLKHKMKNDQLKKYINDYMYCNITGNMSGECLWNLLRQRLDNVAWYQFQDLAKEMYNQIPEDWKPLFKVFKYKKVNIDSLALSIAVFKELLNNVIEGFKLNLEINENNKYLLKVGDNVIDIFADLEKYLDKDLVEKIYLV